MVRYPLLLLYSVFLLLILTGCHKGEQLGYRFPADARIVDVSLEPYHAIPNDNLDDTKAIQQALNDHSGKNRIIYFPNGVYLLSDTLALPKPYKRTILQGESRDKTVLKLRDNCPGFQDAMKAKAMFRTAPVGFSADAFRNGIRTMTFDVGRGNPGAIGVQFFASNQGRMDQIRIRSQEGEGAIGLDLGYNRDNGPALLSNIEIEGFDYGISFEGEVNSMTLEHISLKDQRKCGIYNSRQVMSIRNLYSENKVPALVNVDSGVVTLIGAKLSGGDGEGLAIHNEGWLYGRDIQNNAYRLSIKNHLGRSRDSVSGTIAEFFSHEAASAKRHTHRSLNLPIEEPPHIPWGDPEAWTNVEDYGATPNDTLDDSKALQQAIDITKGTVFFPNGKFRINDTVYLRGNLVRLIGCEARVEGRGAFIVEGGTAPAIIIERINHGYYGKVPILHRSDQTLVLSSLIWSGENTFSGKGKLFIEDVVGGQWRFKNSGLRVWARQLDTESRDEVNITVDGATLWMLGYKTERSHTKLAVLNGGKAEVLGAHIYGNMRPREGPEAKARPVFYAEDSQISLVNHRHICFTGYWADQWVVARQGAHHDTLKSRNATEVFQYFSGY